MVEYPQPEMYIDEPRGTVEDQDVEETEDVPNNDRSEEDDGIVSVEGTDSSDTADGGE